jgi:predicted lipid-binding transport protein (Tim44 family)
MKRFLSVLAAGVIGLTLAGASFDADAQKKRFGGGKNTGMQRDAAPPAKATPPAQQAAPAAGAPAAAPAAAGAAAKGMPGWLGPVGGLLAGGLLAAMFFGGAFENINFGDILTFLLIGLIAFFVIRMLLRRSMPQPAGAAGGYGARTGSAPLAHAPAEFRADQEVSAGSAPVPASRYPADFDVQGFVRSARASFIRLQAANDAKDLADIREFTTPQMYAEIALQAEERGDVRQKTEVCSVNAEVLEVVTEGNKAIASVRFTGLIREDDAPNPEPFDEIWHVEKNLAERNSVWLIAGIQQVG